MTYTEFMQMWLDGSDTVLCHTSGSTGAPKPIALSKNDMRASARITNVYFGITALSTVSVPLPFDYIAARMMAVRAHEAGCRIVTPEPSNTPDFFGEAEDLDLLAIVPSQVEALVAISDAGRRVRCLIVGGAPLSEARRHALVHAGIHGYITYGMTETCSHIALADIADDSGTFRAIAEDTHFATDSRGCLTADISHLSIQRVVTNDLVSLLSPTEFRWLGRADNIINSAGLKICPEELERTLAPLLPEGLVFYIVGVPDEQWGSAVAIVYEGSADLVPTVRNAVARIDDRRRRPRYIYASAHLRRTASGKIIRDIPPRQGLQPANP
mgnify:CR=1 FL=1